MFLMDRIFLTFRKQLLLSMKITHFLDFPGESVRTLYKKNTRVDIPLYKGLGEHTGQNEQHGNLELCTNYIPPTEITNKPMSECAAHLESPPGRRPGKHMGQDGRAGGSSSPAGGNRLRHLPAVVGQLRLHLRRRLQGWNTWNKRKTLILKKEHNTNQNMKLQITC